MNVPNALTMSRFGMALAMMACLALPFPYASSLALLLFLSASVTDALDGHLARTRYGTSDFGRLMDPLADKVLIAAALVSFVGIHLADGRPLLPAWIVVLILLREFMVTGLRLLAAGRQQVISAGTWGKHKTLWQIVVISLILLALVWRNDILPPAEDANAVEVDRILGDFARGAGLLAAAVTLLSGAVYFVEHRGLIRPPPAGSDAS